MAHNCVDGIRGGRGAMECIHCAEHHIAPFGLDSVIELISAGILVWRLNIELRHGHAFSEVVERRASKVGGGLLFALAAG